MKKIIIGVLCVLALQCKASPGGVSPWWLLCNLGYQQGFGLSQPIARPAIDFNMVSGILLFNGAYSYQLDYGFNAYLGIGMAWFAQVQYGYAFGLQKHMIRFRSDIPMQFVNIKYIKDISVGLFVEHTFSCPSKGTMLGLSISYFFPVDLTLKPLWNFFKFKKGEDITRY